MNEREEEIVRTLAEKVRVLTLSQVARTWWTESRWGKSRAKSALSRLAERKLVRLRRALARPIDLDEEAIVEWSIGDVIPDLETVATYLHRRAMTDASMQSIVIAASKAVALFGTGKAASIKLTQLTHDLHVSEVYLRYRDGELVKRWLGEDRLTVDWPVRVRPDAVLIDETGQPSHAVEYGGDYPVDRLIELHEQLASIPLNYEIW